MGRLAHHLSRADATACARVAGGLVASGIEPGDRVAALLPNVPELLEMHFAAPAARAVFVPINVRVSGPELAYILEHCGARAAGDTSQPRSNRRRGGGRARRSAAGDHDPDGPGRRSEYERAPGGGDAAYRSPAPADETDAALCQLHERHHRPAEGCHVHPPRCLPAHAGRHRRGAARHPHRLPVDAADVPLPRLGVHLGGDRDGRRASLPRAVRRRARCGRCSRPARSAISAARRRCSRCSRPIRRRPGCRARCACSWAARRRRPRCCSAGRGARHAGHAPLRADRDVRADRRVRLAAGVGCARRRRSAWSCGHARGSRRS